MRSADHSLICQHPELSLNATGIPIPVLLINTSELEELDEEGVADLCSVLLNASGIDLNEMIQLSPREAIMKFRFENYGAGSHKAFKRMMTNAAESTGNIEKWFSRWCNLHPTPDDIPERFPTPQEFFSRCTEFEDHAECELPGACTD